jgi:hypothetical protein
MQRLMQQQQQQRMLSQLWVRCRMSLLHLTSLMWLQQKQRVS